MTHAVGFTGDVMLGRLVDERQRRRPPAAVWGDLGDRLRALDGLCVNLECCLSTRGRPWRRTYRPFHFRADPTWAVPALADVGVDYASLANNHLMDYEEPALADTLAALDDAGVAHAGAGADRRAAREPARFAIENDAGDPLSIAAVSFTDNTPEFAAGPSRPGVAYVEFDPDDAETRRVVERSLAAARATDPDLLVGSLHWGPNMRTAPPERHRRFARLLVEAGVDLLHGHSAHVFQGIEVLDGAPVLYDCGDFVDDYAVDPVRRNDRSFLFEVVVDGGAIRELRLHPTEIDDCAVWAADSATGMWSRRRMRALSAPFGTEFSQAGQALVLDVADETTRSRRGRVE
ncbi:MAG: CapA family protein [Haloarculaceae archaeon]